MSKHLILVVEEDIYLLRGIRTILELEGYQVISAENGIQALDILRHQSPPDLILSDMKTPKVEGVRFLTELRKERYLDAVPVIFLTPKRERSDADDFRRFGVDDY